MPNVSSFGTQTDNSVVQGTVTDRAIAIPDIPPQGLMSVGPRVTPHFVKPSLWSALTTYHFFDAVHDAAGASYVAIKPEVPAGTELTDEGYWFIWSDPNSQFADLSEIVKTYNDRIAHNTADIAAETTRATEAEATKAPTNHASEDTVYGVGNNTSYGHVRLADADTPLTSDADNGIAVTPKMLDDNLKALSATKAPISHASEEPVYGVGNKTSYGHVRLADADTPLTSDADNGIAVTPKLLDDNLKTLTKKILANHARRNEHVLLIGDSYLLGTHSASATSDGKNWGDTFQKVMGCTVEKFANGGAGFWSNGTTAPYAGMNYAAMINHIVNNYKGDKESVTGIIFEGGYNDVSNYRANNNNDIISAVEAARDAFPNARIMINFTWLAGWGANLDNRTHIGNAYTAYNYASPQCADVFAATLNLNSILSNISYDNIHPNETAQDYLGKLIAYNYMSGQDYDFETSGVQEPLHIDKNHNLVVRTFTHVLNNSISPSDNPGKEVILESGQGPSTATETKYFFAINPSAKTSVGGWGLAVLALQTNGKLQIQNVSCNFNAGESIYIVPFMCPAFW